MTAAWAAIWLAESVVVELDAWLMPTCDKFDVLVDGSVGSKSPCVVECFLAWCLIRGDVAPVCEGVLVPAAGREKF